MSRPTITDVASIRARIEAAVADPGGATPSGPAPPLAELAVVVLIDDGSDPDASLAAQRGLGKALNGSGYGLMLASGEIEQLREFLARQRPFGVVLLPPRSEDETVIALCREIGCRTARIAADQLKDDPQLIWSRDRAAAAGAVAGLVALGHRRIGFVAGPDMILAAREREAGYLETLAQHALDTGAQIIASGDLSFASGMAAGRLLLELSPRPTAIFAANDAMAAGVLHAAHQAGIAIPAELSVIGFGDGALAEQSWPPLTTLRVPIEEMAQAAARMLINGTVGERAFEPELIVRESAGPVG